MKLADETNAFCKSILLTIERLNWGVKTFVDDAKEKLEEIGVREENVKLRELDAEQKEKEADWVIESEKDSKETIRLVLQELVDREPDATLRQKLANLEFALQHFNHQLDPNERHLLQLHL